MEYSQLVSDINKRIHDPPNKSFIHFVPPNMAEDPVLKRMYKRVSSSRKSVANIHQSQSLMPDVIKAHLDLYMAIMYNEDDELTRRTKELIATIVSFLNACKYCITHHYEALLVHWPTAPNPDQILLLGTGAGINDMEWKLVQFAELLTNRPYSVTSNNIEKLKKAGLSDRAILNIILIISYFNFVNRLALATGCPLEPKEERNYKY